MMKTSYSALPILLLNLLHRNPQTGYSLCKQIEQMPLGQLSGSPGSIYPCLRKLETDGAVVGKAFGGEIKPRKKFRLTAKGKRALKKWASLPLSASTVIKSPEFLFIRLSFAELEDKELRRQLETLTIELEEEHARLKAYARSAGPQMSTGGYLAISLAIDLIGFLTSWAKNSGETISRIKT